jgi:hypothetical protein
MNESRSTIESLAGQLTVLLAPLTSLTPEGGQQFLTELGLSLDEAQINTLTPALIQAISSISALIDAQFELDVSIEAGNSGIVVQKRLVVLNKIAIIIAGFTQLQTALAGLGLPDADVILKDLPRRLFNLLLARYLGHSRGVLELLQLGGVLVRTDHNIGIFDPAKPFFTTNDFDFRRLGGWLSDPSKQLRELFDWGQPAFDGKKLLSLLDRIIAENGLPTWFDASTPKLSLDLLFVKLSPRTDLNPRGIELELSHGLSKGIIELGPQRWTMALKLDTNILADTRMVIQPGTIQMESPEATTLVGKASLEYVYVEKETIVLLSFLDLARITVEEVSASTGLQFRADGSAEFTVRAELRRGKVRIGTSTADGFIQKILGGFQLESHFDLSLTFGLSEGLRFAGANALEVQLASHTNIGPISIDALTFNIGVKGNAFPITITTDLKASLGPLAIYVQGLGFGTALALVDFDKGNLGPIDIWPSFKPPNGVGLSLDAGGFKGGGVLLFNEKKGEYAGALELDFQGFISVKAIGVINTKMPDGAAGFSLLIVISAEFTPIQLSFGFTLNGVGGIIGLNRTIFVSALAEGVRTNAIKSILFPENIVANISRIISDIKQFFPPLDDHFVVGPMGKLGWGTPSIITLELGLLLDLPNPMFAIVGVLKAVLPDESAPLLRLQVNFVGVLDFDHGYIFFRADLYDSRLLLFSLTGSMAFLVSWGEQQTFALSVGGFHPDFRDFPSIPALPDGFRNMARIGISLLSDDNPRLKIECYFAVTSNTVQFGAKVELYAEAVGFNVYGFLGYDVLFQFDPFRFIASLYGGIALREDTSVFAGINFLARFAGPGLWDAKGEAGLTILFIEISIDFHVTWGDPPPAIEPATEDLLALLKRELANTGNWRAELPPNNHFGVTLKKIEPPVGEELLVIYPAGVLTFSQRSLPLEDYLIQKYGNKKPLKENRFKLTNANSNGKVIPADFQGVRELFAPGNFTELSDSDKLSRKSFDHLPSGFKLTATSDLVVGKPVSRPVRYELNYLRRKQFQLIFVGVVDLAARAYNLLVKSSAVRQSALSLQQTRKSLNAPAEVHLPQEMFALASTANLKSHLYDGQNAVLFTTQAEAYQKHQEMISQNPALAGQIQVVSHYELNQG